MRESADVSICSGRRADLDRPQRSTSSSGSSACRFAATRLLRSRPFRNASSSSARSSWRSPSRFPRMRCWLRTLRRYRSTSLPTSRRIPNACSACISSIPHRAWNSSRSFAATKPATRRPSVPSRSSRDLGRPPSSLPTPQASSSTAWLARITCRRCARSNVASHRRRSSMRSRAVQVFAWGLSS